MANQSSKLLPGTVTSVTSKIIMSSRPVQMPLGAHALFKREPIGAPRGALAANAGMIPAVSPSSRSAKRGRRTNRGPRFLVGGYGVLPDRSPAIDEAVKAAGFKDSTMWHAAAVDVALKHPSLVEDAVDGIASPLSGPASTEVPQPRSSGDDSGCSTRPFVGGRVQIDRVNPIDASWQMLGLKSRTVWLAAAIDVGLMNPDLVQRAAGGIDRPLDETDAPHTGAQLTLSEHVLEASA